MLNKYTLLVFIQDVRRGLRGRNVGKDSMRSCVGV